MTGWRPAARAARALASLALATATLSACGSSVEAPSAKGVCWHMVQQKGGKVRFFVLSRNQPDLEHCAANLEAMRRQFLTLGGSNQEVDGAFQGQFLYIDPRGVFTSPDSDKTPYLALVRTGDGRLVVPGAAAQDQ